MNTNSHSSIKLNGILSRPLAPRQERSRETEQRFLAAARELLRERSFSDLSVAELAARAGRSVGVFYRRFPSKEEFLDLLMRNYFMRGIELCEKVQPSADPAATFSECLHAFYRHIVDNRNLWHAALQQSANDPDYWTRYGAYREAGKATIHAKVEEARGRVLTPEEMRRLALSQQVFNSVINNQIINAPGPLELEDADFFPQLCEIVLDIARLDRLRDQA
ncbi:AcrR family transcriptional regulator [Altererythrobacter atlanticus]|uniref:TetR family regulatory protein n=1 Tax=Croceibacterium atlanticum TaxID=1267766 RepID=A0A0F7KSX3_9SPHN|nr:TetR/AcrR family transcriptional regulator [Croceibacterium atlanticum]AKH42251.1 TetR family regulatory protein [Croceibacterium atlanticum]MBB5731027.1 AcrR family transcriptional regulator [Croceibacterium atlanticum]